MSRTRCQLTCSMNPPDRTAPVKNVQLRAEVRYFLFILSLQRVRGSATFSCRRPSHLDHSPTPPPPAFVGTVVARLQFNQTAPYLEKHRTDCHTIQLLKQRRLVPISLDFSFPFTSSFFRVVQHERIPALVFLSLANNLSRTRPKPERAVKERERTLRGK